MKKWTRASSLTACVGMAMFLSMAASSVAYTAEPTAPLKVVGGNKVDAETFEGWRTWRAMSCERCHGAKQEGMVGPSLIASLKVLTKEQFKATVLNGRPEKGMPNFGGSKQVADNIDNLYRYLKGRSDGQVEPGHLQKLE